MTRTTTAQCQSDMAPIKNLLLLPTKFACSCDTRISRHHNRRRKIPMSDTKHHLTDIGDI